MFQEIEMFGGILFLFSFSCEADGSTEDYTLSPNNTIALPGKPSRPVSWAINNLDWLE